MILKSNNPIYKLDELELNKPTAEIIGAFDDWRNNKTIVRVEFKEENARTTNVRVYTLEGRSKDVSQAEIEQFISNELNDFI